MTSPSTMRIPMSLLRTAAQVRLTRQISNSSVFKVTSVTHSMGQFDERAVIITGSSSGIGRATAQLFAREGASVTLCGRNETSLQESKRLVLAENGNNEAKVVLVKGDLREEDVMKKTIDETVEKFGRLDVLINNAGGVATGSPLVGSEIDGDLGRFDYAWEINTKSILRLCQLALPHLEKAKGEIVNVSSIAGLNNGSGSLSPFYSIAKAAQDQLTRNLALHYITKGVRVNSVNPGAVATSILQKQGFTDEMVKKCEDAMVAEFRLVPCQRIGQPEDIAEAILFLADRKRSSYIVGHQLVVDGGSSLHFPLSAEGPQILASVLPGSNPHK
ncbi:unnamed protein product [Cylicocyclus nassatus]|uniref:Uncharacterized protein n=1 Tax=Cylicocyclus nassatus TaxID=53992 RepID=A0AA36LZE3_CYLNA|nr:unnamed protein product [Cylicocyclus nassatus]